MKDQLKFVQILRGFAAMVVVLFYLDLATFSYFGYYHFPLNYGYLGIDFFFVLTGFIITFVHLRDIEHKSSVKKFILKRTVRIFPFYWLVLLITIGLESPDFHEKPTLRTAINPTSIDGWITIIKNILLYPLPDSQMPLGIAWSLNYGIVFYLVFAICIKLGWRSTRYVFALWLAIVMINAFNIFPSTVITELLSNRFIIELLIGSIAGYLFVKNKLQLNSMQLMFSFVAIAVLLTAFMLWQGFDSNTLVFKALLGSAFSLLIYYTAAIDREKKFKQYASPFFVLIGDASYSIFLTCTILIPYLLIGLNKLVNMSVVPGFFKNILMLLIFIVTIFAGILTYLIIERPLLNSLRRKFRLKQKRKSWI